MLGMTRQMHDCTGTELHCSCSQHSPDNSPATCVCTYWNKANNVCIPKNVPWHQWGVLCMRLFGAFPLPPHSISSRECHRRRPVPAFQAHPTTALVLLGKYVFIWGDLDHSRLWSVLKLPIHPFFCWVEIQDTVPNPVPFVGVVREGRYKQQRERGRKCIFWWQRQL